MDNFLFIVLQVSGDDLSSIIRPMLDDRTISFDKITGRSGIYGFINRWAINDFRYSFFYSFEGGSALFIYFDTYGGLLRWIRDKESIFVVLLIECRGGQMRG